MVDIYSSRFLQTKDPKKGVAKSVRSGAPEGWGAAEQCRLEVFSTFFSLESALHSSCLPGHTYSCLITVIGLEKSLPKCLLQKKTKKLKSGSNYLKEIMGKEERELGW